MSLKQKIIRTISDGFHGLGNWIMEEYYSDAKQGFKVTRGENYIDMPYVVLDTPQLKSNELEGKLRIMFWWGHYISLQFFLNTSSLALPDPSLIKSNSYFILTGDNLFNNELNAADFCRLDEYKQEMSTNQEITKICMKVDLNDMEEIQAHISTFMNDMSSFMKQRNA